MKRFLSLTAILFLVLVTSVFGWEIHEGGSLLTGERYHTLIGTAVEFQNTAGTPFICIRALDDGTLIVWINWGGYFVSHTTTEIPVRFGRAGAPSTATAVVVDGWGDSIFFRNPTQLIEQLTALEQGDIFIAGTTAGGVGTMVGAWSMEGFAAQLSSLRNQ